MNWLAFFTIAVFAIGDSAPAKFEVFANKQNPFGNVRKPTVEPTRVVGGYSAGCLAGAAELPKQGPGFEVMRLSRHRSFGHPSLVALLQRAGHEIGGRSRIFIGDMSLPRGGPMPSGHSSHQIGLDADIWYFTYSKTLTDKLREQLRPKSILKKDVIHIDESRWKSLYEDQLLWFAAQSEVERIFVNGAIKKRLCGLYPTDVRLKKLRPWFEHEDHFHVRLKCPSDQPGCEPQKEPDGIECDQEHLKDWFSDVALDKLRHPTPPPPRKVALPAECRAVVRAK